MRRLFFVMSLLLILIVPQAWGATTQYPDPNRQTMWNNITDKMNTWGQSPQEAKMTKIRLHNARARARLQNIFQARRQAIINNNS